MQVFKITLLPRNPLMDAIKGFALIGIVMINAMTHFNFSTSPEQGLLFSSQMDQRVMYWTTQLIGGKAYAIFALTFGWSTYIQYARSKSMPKTFVPYLLRRMGILALASLLFSLLFKEDLLYLYTLAAIPLLLLTNWPTKALLALALVLILQIPLLCRLAIAFLYPSLEAVNTTGQDLAATMNFIYAKGSLGDVLGFNFWQGRSLVWTSLLNTGKYMQLLGFLIMGVYLGKCRYFDCIETHQTLIYKLLFASISMILVLHSISAWVVALLWNEKQQELLSTLLLSYRDFAHILLTISALVLVYIKTKTFKVWGLLTDYGRFSLSHYTSHIFVGIVFFFGFGFGMYRYMGASLSLVYALVCIAMQMGLGAYWSRYIYYGPIEYVWRALSYYSFAVPFLKVPKETSMKYKDDKIALLEMQIALLKERVGAVEER